MITIIDISERLREIRKSRSLTIQAVANGIETPLRTYQNYEYGVREISVEALYKLADFYGVSTDYLLERESNPNGIEILVKEFGLSELEKLFMQTYLESEPKFRESFVIFAEKIVANKEKRTKENSQT